MKLNLLPVYILLMIFTIGCDHSILGEEPGTSPVELFDQLWSEVDVTYSFFQHKSIDWHAVYDEHHPFINSEISDAELFDRMASMLNSLEDGHVNLFGNRKTSEYTGWYDPYPVNYYPNVVSEEYLLWRKTTRVFEYGILRSANIGYIHIHTFGDDIKQYQNFKDILSQLGDVDGIIIDLRNNGGGTTNNSRLIIEHFINESKIFAFVRHKNGPGQSDFTDWKSKKLELPDFPPYTKPVALLTNRICFSTTEYFILQMRALSHVTVIGDTTGGGAGIPIFKELANGWTYRISRSQTVTNEKEQYEGIGLFPDIPIWTTKTDSINGVDRILDAAIVRIQSN